MEPHSKWTMPLLRLGMGLFLALWGIDKLAATESSRGIFSHFYGVEAGTLLLQFAGIAELLLGLALAVGLFRVPVAWIALAVNGVSTFASWRQILDPWGWLGLTKGGTHLFLASIVILATNVVLVLNARDDRCTLDARLRRREAVG
ncbi:MAG: DoxX family membrane protein [Gemmatimonadota bacterium]